MSHKKDLRIIKTNNNIRHTFIQLVYEKDFDSVTVQNILDRALINRSTFYKHYSDKYDLAETICKEFLEEFKSFVDVRFSNKEDFNGLMRNMDNLYEKLYEQKTTILGLWKIRTEKIDLYDDMQTVLKQKYIEFAKHNVDKSYNINYHACIFSSLVLTSIKFILDNQEIYTGHQLIEELKAFFNAISTGAIKSSV